MPAGYRPLGEHAIAPAFYSQYAGYIEVNSAGVVSVGAPFAGDYSGQIAFPVA